MSGGDRLRIPASAIEAIGDEVLAFGSRDVETGGFVMAARDGDTVSIVAVAGNTGIVRRGNLFVMSELALDRIFTFADDRQMWIPAQFHSHRLGAFLSETDKEHGLRVDGFISVVIPTYSDPPRDVARWGWWRFGAGRWRTIEPGGIAGGQVDVVRFDEDGVRGP